MLSTSEELLEHDYDGYWKELLERFLPECLTLLAPDLNELIDFTQPIRSLDTELHELFPQDRSGRHFVDKLVQVSLRDGQRAGLLLHVDVQVERDPDFSLRMFRYHYRLFDKYELPIYSVALLGDLDPRWRPQRFVRRVHDNLTFFRYRVVKLVAFLDRLDELERSENPAALLLLAFLRTRTSRPDRLRLHWKTQLFALILERGFPFETIQSLCRLADWLMRIPADLTLEFRKAMKDLAEQTRKPILMDLEIEAMNIGEARGEARATLRTKRDSIVQILTARFRDCPETIVRHLDGCDEPTGLDRLLVEAATASDLTAFTQSLTAALRQP